ncbi:agmatine deiminase family protein [Rufibacter hautae]|uniref:Agmatine deiminase family protein n=1 Tax=Rufibacter hautae TaxID=2595005 RepID=A0A5B6TCM5_9BACT|nr:agmatine deiminase family protein [Rufibacter hautae]KAA3436739.1 agmatine deiminase family protein [Rufibacter hautae]
MITDNQTNFLYLADTLLKLYPDFYQRFEQTLKEAGIEHSLLPNTKDVWAVDYMPIQVTRDEFVQFVYNPSYLQAKVWQKTISNVDSICTSINLQPKKSNILVDGGNVVKAKNKVIMCQRVFTENPHIPEKKLIKELQELFQVDQLIFIPTQPKDFTGHADGMVRFLDEKTVLINDYSKEKKDFQLLVKSALHNAGLDWVEIPYNPYSNKKDKHANGIYINFLQMKGTLVLPVFGQKEDEETVKLFGQLFPNVSIATVDSNEIALEGGILNCITWNIMT